MKPQATENQAQKVSPGIREEFRTTFFRPLLPALNGSITTEAALLVPIFLFFCMHIFSLLEISRLQTKISYGMWKAGNELAACAYVLRDEELSLTEEFVLLETLVRADVTRYIGSETLSAPVLKGGALGLSFLSTSFPQNGDVLDLQVRYFASPIPSVFRVGWIPLGSRCYVHSWTGYAPPKEEGTDEEETYVYITPNGEVYHIKEDCTYLKPEVRAVETEAVEDAVNAGGSHYKPCRICRDHEPGDQLYITTYGESYHTTLGCSAINHTILRIPLSQAGERRCCSKCGGGE